MVKSTKKHPQRGNEKKSVIHNPYGSTSCIRFEGIISAPSGHPFAFYAPKLHKKRKRRCRFPKKSMPAQELYGLYAHPIFYPRKSQRTIMRLFSTARPFSVSVKLYTPEAIPCKGTCIVRSPAPTCLHIRVRPSIDVIRTSLFCRGCSKINSSALQGRWSSSFSQVLIHPQWSIRIFNPKKVIPLFWGMY